MNKNEQAFPSTAFGGFSKREYMAIHLMAGLETWSPVIHDPSSINVGSPEWHALTQKARAEYAVASADALLEALNK